MALRACVIFLCFPQTSSLPKWSWDTVQTFIQFANQSGTFGSDATDAFQKQAFVVFEKDQGRWPQSPQPDGYPLGYETDAETKISLACDQVKLASPTTDCYMYTESDWARTQYNLGNDLDALENSDPDGEPQGYELFCGDHYASTWDNVTCKGCDPQQDFDYQYRAYDFRNEDTQNMWVDRVVDNMGDGKSIDGVFVDGNRDAWTSSVTKDCTTGEAEAWGQGLNASMWLLRKRCDLAATNSDHGCTIISNYDTEDALQMSDGGMLEQFGCSVKNIGELTELGQNGFLAQVHAQSANNEDNFAYALACFLVGANQYSYFGAGKGWEGEDEDSVMTTWITDWPEYSKPLGEPDGDALVEVSGPNNETTTYFRSFATGTTVFVNLTSTESSSSVVDLPPRSSSKASTDQVESAMTSQLNLVCIHWSDGTTTGNAC